MLELVGPAFLVFKMEPCQSAFSHQPLPSVRIDYDGPSSSALSTVSEKMINYWPVSLVDTKCLFLLQGHRCDPRLSISDLIRTKSILLFKIAR